jgi:hypothetical protein
MNIPDINDRNCNINYFRCHEYFMRLSVFIPPISLGRLGVLISFDCQTSGNAIKYVR